MATAGGTIPPGICVSPLPAGTFARRLANIPGPWGMSQSASGNIRIPGGMIPLPVGIIPPALRMIPSRMRMFATPRGMFPRSGGMSSGQWTLPAPASRTPREPYPASSSSLSCAGSGCRSIAGGSRAFSFRLLLTSSAAK
jgi:hypothetical protein